MCELFREARRISDIWTYKGVCPGARTNESRRCGLRGNLVQGSPVTIMYVSMFNLQHAAKLFNRLWNSKGEWSYFANTCANGEVTKHDNVWTVRGQFEQIYPVCLCSLSSLEKTQWVVIKAHLFAFPSHLPLCILTDGLQHEEVFDFVIVRDHLSEHPGSVYRD